MAEKWDAKRPAAVAMRTVAPAPSAALGIAVLLDVGACPPVVRYESIRRGTLRILRRYCSDRTEPARRFPKV
jgi:hypothetical protein